MRSTEWHYFTAAITKRKPEDTTPWITRHVSFFSQYFSLRRRV